MKKYIQSKECFSTKIKNNFIILNTENGLYHELNDTGSAIWEIIEVEKSIDEMVANLMTSHIVDEKTCIGDTFSFIEEGLKKNIIIEIREGL